MAITLRGVVFCLVAAIRLREARQGWRASTHLGPLSRASIGFSASVTVTVLLMLALTAAGSPSPPEVAATKIAASGLRGSI